MVSEQLDANGRGERGPVDLCSEPTEAAAATWRQ